MAELQVILFGGLEIAGGDAAAGARLTRKAKALIAYLALQGSRGQSREKLADLLWGNSAEEQTRANLRQTLSSIRKALSGGADCLATKGDQISLAGPGIELDVSAFERFAEEATPAALGHAAQLYKGDLLDGFSLKEDSFEAWVRVERERLRHRACEVLAKLVSYRDGVGDTDRCVEVAARLLQLDPLRESAHRILMRSYAAQGRQASALKQFEICRDVLARELRVEPESETVKLYREIRQQRAATVQARADTLSLDRAKEPPLPDGPSLAVLPFDNMSEDPEQQYFSDGITSDITTGLGRFRDLFVISDASSFTFRDKGVPVQEVGRDLGVQHILRGSVRRAGGKIRISAQLIQAATGQCIWAESYDRVLDDVFAIQDEIARTIVATLAGRLENAAHHRSQRGDAAARSVYDCLLRGRHCLGNYTKKEILEARRIFEHALELDPDHARTYVELADTYFYELQSTWSDAPEIAGERLFDFAQRAVALDDLDCRAHAALGRAYYRVKANYELAEAQFEKAIALNPNDVWNYCGMGLFLTCSGRLEEAVSCDSYALRLNPLLPDTCLFSIGVARYLGGRYEEAISTFGKMSNLNPEILGCLAASYAKLERDEEARAASAECLKRFSAELAVSAGDDATRWQSIWLRLIPIKDAEARDRLFDGLRKAGLPA